MINKHQLLESSENSNVFLWINLSSFFETLKKKIYISSYKIRLFDILTECLTSKSNYGLFC